MVNKFKEKTHASLIQSGMSFSLNLFITLLAHYCGPFLVFARLACRAVLLKQGTGKPPRASERASEASCERERERARERESERKRERERERERAGREREKEGERASEASCERERERERRRASGERATERK